jgi:hypothetical protein
MPRQTSDLRKAVPSAFSLVFEINAKSQGRKERKAAARIQEPGVRSLESVTDARQHAPTA